MELNKIYNNRFNKNSWQKRSGMWRVLCENFFNKYVKPEQDILDIAAGYCEFINNIARPKDNCKAGRRIAVDLNPDLKIHAESFVEVYNAPAQELIL